MELPPQQLALGGFAVLAQFDQAEGQAPDPPAHLLPGRRTQLIGLPLLVVFGQLRGQAHHQPTAERGNLPPHGHPVGSGLGQVELAAAGEGTHERRMSAPAGAEPQSVGGGGQR